jgi:cytochrome d ubiquinol oxidase subunit II
MWTLENLAAGTVLLGLVMYAVFGGADFGGGIWTALASGPRAREQRESLFHAIGPVWETNHVWLIFVVVTLFTCFPTGFGALFTVLLVPLVIALIGINFRGAAFAFRHFGSQVGEHVPLMAGIFAVSSILTPFAFGMAVTASVTGKIVLINGLAEAVPRFWLSPFTLVGGLVGMGVCAYLAPIYMAVRTDGELQGDFRRRGMIAGLALGILTAVEVPIAMMEAPLFAGRLMAPPAAFIVVLAAIFGITTQILLWRRRFPWAQLCSAGAVSWTIAGFVAAMYPDFIVGQLTLAGAAAPHATLVAYFFILVIGTCILVPSLLFLYWTFRGKPNPAVEQP